MVPACTPKQRGTKSNSQRPSNEVSSLHFCCCSGLCSGPMASVHCQRLFSYRIRTHSDASFSAPRRPRFWFTFGPFPRAVPLRFPVLKPRLARLHFWFIFGPFPPAVPLCFPRFEGFALWSCAGHAAAVLA